LLKIRIKIIAFENFSTFTVGQIYDILTKNLKIILPSFFKRFGLRKTQSRSEGLMGPLGPLGCGPVSIAYSAYTIATALKKLIYFPLKVSKNVILTRRNSSNFDQKIIYEKFGQKIRK
jgi:hypothetical protein